MYIFVDCGLEGGAWKAKRLSDLKAFVRIHFQCGTRWIHFREQDVCVSDCEYYEAQKVDGRTIKDVAWI